MVAVWRAWWRFVEAAWRVHVTAVEQTIDALRGWPLAVALFGLALAGLTGTPWIVVEIAAAALGVYGWCLVEAIREGRRR